ncbi:MAG: hypothetical protein RIM80_11155 [Alphaproteobacteria bacterium]
MRSPAVVALAIFPLFSAVSGPAAAGAMQTEKVCIDLARKERAGDVAYQPGVDVRGRRVVRADVNPHPATIPAPSAVDVSVVLRGEDFAPGDRRLRGEVPVGRFFVRSDGVVSYEGQPLTPEMQQEVSVVCRQVWGDRLPR